MLVLLTLHNPPKGMVVMVPRSEIIARRYTKRDIERGKACCKSRNIVCDIAEDR